MKQQVDVQRNGHMCSVEKETRLAYERGRGILCRENAGIFEIVVYVER